MKRSRRSLRILVLVSSLAMPLGYAVFAGTPASASSWKVVAKGSNTGADSVANVNAAVPSNVKLEVTVPKPALVQWTFECLKGSKLVKTTGKETLAAAGSVQVKLIKSGNDCQLAGNALNEGSGKITLSIKSSG